MGRPVVVELEPDDSERLVAFHHPVVHPRGEAS